MADAAQVTVFTITFDQRAKLLALLGDLALQDHPADLLEVVVLDDGGSDGTAEAAGRYAAELPYRLTVLAREHEDDYLSARRWNECIAAASRESTVLIQLDDVRVQPDLVSRHARWHADGCPRIVTGARFDGDDPTWSLSSCARGHLADLDGSAREVDAWTAVWGASLSYPRTLVEALWREPHERPFDERMIGWGFHEVEFAYRATRAGATVVYDPAVGVFHQHHSSAGDRGRAIDHDLCEKLHGDRNADYVRRKHGLRELPRW